MRQNDGGSMRHMLQVAFGDAEYTGHIEPRNLEPTWFMSRHPITGEPLENRQLIEFYGGIGWTDSIGPWQRALLQSYATGFEVKAATVYKLPMPDSSRNNQIFVAVALGPQRDQEIAVTYMVGGMGDHGGSGGAAWRTVRQLVLALCADSGAWPQTFNGDMSMTDEITSFIDAAVNAKNRQFADEDAEAEA